MKSIRQILQGKKLGLVSVTPDTTVYRALETMAEHEVGALLVLDGDKLVGIFSERDYARRMILHGRTSRDTPVSAWRPHLGCSTESRSSTPKRVSAS